MCIRPVRRCARKTAWQVIQVKDGPLALKQLGGPTAPTPKDSARTDGYERAAP